MRFCAVICEYNPLHNGHAYQLDVIRRESGCDAILCLMSGNFTQRGEDAVLGKYIRARHAVLAGADAVLELPVSFSVAPAELFAGGAVHLLASLPDVDTLAFGCESGTSERFLAAAKATLSEDKRFRDALKEALKQGVSYAKAHTDTVLALNADVDEALLTAPNNILGIEYCRALLREQAGIRPMAIPRVGARYADATPLKNFSSATALRACLADRSRKTQKLLKSNMPPFVYRDLQDYAPTAFREAALCALLRASEEALRRVPDCTEGLEHRLKALAASNPEYGAFLQKTVTKRYTLSRIRRILAANFLWLEEKQTRRFLRAPLYYNVLAVRKQGADALLASLSRGAYPVLVRKSDAALLKKDAQECFACDVRADELYRVLKKQFSNPFQTLFVER